MRYRRIEQLDTGILAPAEQTLPSQKAFKVLYGRTASNHQFTLLMVDEEWNVYCYAPNWPDITRVDPVKWWDVSSLIQHIIFTNFFRVMKATTEHCLVWQWITSQDKHLQFHRSGHSHPALRWTPGAATEFLQTLWKSCKCLSL